MTQRPQPQPFTACNHRSRLLFVTTAPVHCLRPRQLAYTSTCNSAFQYTLQLFFQLIFYATFFFTIYFEHTSRRRFCSIVFFFSLSPPPPQPPQPQPPLDHSPPQPDHSPPQPLAHSQPLLSCVFYFSLRHHSRRSRWLTRHFRLTDFLRYFFFYYLF